VSDLFIIVMAAAVLPAGVPGDTFGRKKVFLAGLGLTLTGSLLALAARDVPVLWAAKAVMGAGALMPSSLGLVSQAVPDPRTGARHFAAWVGAQGAGLALGGISAGAILGQARWPWIFLPVAASSAAALGVAALALTGSVAPGERALTGPVSSWPRSPWPR
jgi:MFS family permease